MVTYLVLVTLTEAGRQNFKKAYTTSRVEMETQVKKMGGKVTRYMTAGPYDAVEMYDFPSYDVTLGVFLNTLSVNAIRTMTMRALPADDVIKTLKSTP